MRERSIVPWVVVLLLLLVQLVALHAFRGPSSRTLLGKQPPRIPCSLHPTTTVASATAATAAATASRLSCRLCSKKSNNNNKREESESPTSGPEEYRNAATKILSRFMSSPSPDNQERSDSQPQTNDDDDTMMSRIDWDAQKIGKVPLDTLAQALDAELYASEWFVTGRVNPRYFSDQFRFQDPDVKVTGIRAYAQGVRKIFNQPTCRAEIISTTVAASTNNNNNTNTITCTWRLSGKVDIRPGLTIKPYIVYTDFTVDEETGLIVFQEDRFDLPGWDILLSAFFPFLIGKITADPAPAPEPRNPPPTVPAGVLSSDNGNTGKRIGNLFPWFK